MKEKLLTLVFFLTLLPSIFLNFYFYFKIQEESQVVEVVDGDTFQLKSGKRVRLLGVDAPEYSRCGGREAKERLKELIEGKKVSLKEEQSEAYGHGLALVYVGRTFINKIILEEGWQEPTIGKIPKGIF